MENENTLEVKTFIPEYKVLSNTAIETKIAGIERISELHDMYIREYVIKKNKAFIDTWLKCWSDESLIRLRNILNVVMDERGIKNV